MAESLDISALESSLGAYCREAKDVIYAAIYGGIKTKDYMTPYGMIKDQEPLTRSILGSNIVTSSKSDIFAGKANAMAPDARILQREDFDVDLTFTPDIIWKTWLGKYANVRPSDPYFMPFEAFFMEEVIKKAANELEIQAIWNGAKVPANVANKTATAGEVIDGLLKLIDDASADIPAGNKLGTHTALTASNALEEIEKVADLALDSGDLEGTELKCFVRNEVKRWYQRDYRSTFGGNNDFAGTNQLYQPLFIDGTNIEICACPGMTGSDAITIAPKEHMVFTGAEPGESIIIEKEKRQLNILLDFSWGANFVDPLTVFHNDAPDIDGVL